MLTAPQISTVQAFLFEGKSIEASAYLVAQGYALAYAQQRIGFYQQINLSKIVRGTFSDRDLITTPFDGMRFVVIGDGLTVDDYEGIEFIYTSGSWKNASGFEE